MIDRRTFLATGAALAVLPCLPVWAASSKRKLRVGILSDIHVRDRGWTYDPFVAALTWLDAQKVDAVILAGDMADSGLVEQLQLVGEAWDRQFPGDKAADGRSVTKLFVTGNHDDSHYNNGFAKEKYPDDAVRKAHAISSDYAAAWQDSFHEAYAEFSIKTVKGYAFVLRQYHSSSAGIAPYLESVRDRLMGTRPFFYIQHQHLKDTCYGPWAWGRDDGRSTQALSAFPNAVAFSGHSHYPLTDNRSVWQGAFTSVGTGNLSYMSTPYGYDNGDVDTGDASEPVKEMAVINEYQGRHGLIMDVYDNRLVLSRYDLSGTEMAKLGPDWILPLPFSQPGPFAFAEKDKNVPAPQFASGAKIAFRQLEGVNRKQERHAQVELSFPAALPGLGQSRVFDYEVRVSVDGKETQVKRMLSPTCHRPPAEDKGGTVSCLFAATEVPKGATLTVAPRNCYGKAGQVIKGRF